MASLVTMPFTFNREELKDLSKVIGERFYNHPAISELHDIEQGVKYDTQILFSNRLGLLAKQITGCTPASASGLTFSEKTWVPKDFSFRLEHCSADVNVQNKLLRQFQKMNPDFYNVLEGMGVSAIGQFLVGFIENAMLEDILYKIWWSDTNAAIISGGGVFKNTFDVDFVNVIDGLWAQIETAIPNAAAQAEVASLVLTGNVSTTGNFVITLDGVAVNVAVVDTDTAAQAATKVRNETYTGWTTGGSGTTITFTSDTTGERIDAIFSAGTTAGTTGVMTTTTQGTFIDPRYVAIAKNEGGSYAAQALVADEAETIFKAMYAKADSRLLSDPEIKLLVTRSLYENYMTTLETRQGNGGITQYGEDGNPILKFRGVTIVNMGNLWDVFIQSYMDNGTTLHLPHRALLTVKSNIPVATVNENDFSTLNAFFADYQNLNVIDAAFNLDVKFLEKYLAVAAY